MSFKAKKQTLLKRNPHSFDSGIICSAEASNCRSFWQVLFEGMCAALLYMVVWGSICSMASLSPTGVLPLAVGGAFATGYVLLPEKRIVKMWFLAAGVAVVALTLILGARASLDGAFVVINRLFAASELKQAYVYNKFAVLSPEESWQSCIRYAMFSAGLASGIVCGIALRYRLKLLIAFIFLALAMSVAYLGVSPSWEWIVMMAVVLPALMLNLRLGRGNSMAMGTCAVGIAAVAVVSLLVLMLWPGEDMRLSEWDEHARDILSMNNVAYSDRVEPEKEQETQPPEEEREFYQEEDVQADFGGNSFEWLVPVPTVAVILLAALLLFLPAVISDLQKKRRARNREGIESGDNSASIRAMFLYTLRWFRLGGLVPKNLPFSGYAEQIEELFSPELRAEFESILPLWQEAAYSKHEMDEEKRRLMQQFMEDAKSRVWESSGRIRRILAKYIYVL